MITLINQELINTIKRLPNSPGVYLFKDKHHAIIYIGKAKNLRSRVSSYLQTGKDNPKAETIVVESECLEHIPTATELEAMLLEAKLIQSHQPKYNVLFKSGQPFLYLMITSTPVPELKLVRQKKKKGTYFGPFIEKSPARRVFDFLIKTFRLKLCGKKIEQGCLYYHLGICAGSCRPDFSLDAYLQRIELARKALNQGHKKFLEYLQEQIHLNNQKLAFEKSREFHRYYEAFEKVFETLEAKTAHADERTRKDIWIFTPDHKALFLFTERDNVLKKKACFNFPLNDASETLLDYVESYYRTTPPAAYVLINFDLNNENKLLLASFLQEWHQQTFKPTIQKPEDGHFAGLIRMALIHAQHEQEKQLSIAKALKKFLEFTHEPHTIDCFDVSHKQGTFVVGSCIRFKDGQPDPNNFRRFKITIDQNDDYANLREIVTRRYQNQQEELPDLILIDGGKGQLNAVKDLFPQTAFISLAKREETIFSSHFPQGKILDIKTYPAQVLIALRDYAHHFAISYHRKLASQFDIKKQ